MGFNLKPNTLLWMEDYLNELIRIYRRLSDEDRVRASVEPEEWI